MKFNNKFIVIWWVSLLVIFAALIISRFNHFTSNTMVPFDYILLILLFILVFLPLYSEMSMFGFSLKKEIESVETSVNDLKMLVVSNTNSNHVYLNSDPNLNEQQKEQIQKNFRTTNEVNKNIIDEFLSKKSDVVNYFAIRYLLEKEIRRIAVNHLSEPNKNTVINLYRILDNHGVFDPYIGNAFLEIWTTTSKVIHGEEIRESDKRFVDSVGPNLVRKLKEII